MNNKPLNLVKITTGVFEYYKANVNNNSNNSYLLSRKKLTKNWMLGNKMNITKEYEFRNYGNLIMKRDIRTDTIINLLNDRTCYMPFTIDKEEKKRIELMLGLITEDNEIKEHIIETESDNTYKTRFNKFRNYLCDKYSQALQNIRG